MEPILNQVKHALFLENDLWRKDQLINEFYKYLCDQHIECTIIDRASHRRDEVMAALPKIDAIFFQSTFLYADEVKGVGDLLKKCPKPLLVFGMPTHGTLNEHIQNLWSVEELAQMSHHRVFELLHIYPQHADEGEWYTEVNMIAFKEQFDKAEQDRKNLYANLKKTGNKVLIKTINAFGKQWSNLKEGDIVDELDGTPIDETPERGIWVMGLTEPVKLLNSDGYDEWEFSDPTADALAREFYARGNKTNYPDQGILADWIWRYSPININGTELWDWCDEICTMVGVQRRGNRRHFERRLLAYGEKFTYIRDGRRNLKSVYSK